MKRLIHWFNNSSLKVKWSLSASAAIFFAFFIFSFFQYYVISNWLLGEEENSVSQVLEELSVFYRRRAPIITWEDVYDSYDLMKQINERDQTIRILDATGKEVLTARQTNSQPFSIPFEPVRDKTIKLIKTEKGDVYVGVIPIRSNEFNGYVEVVHPLKRYHKMMKNFLATMAIFGSFALLFSGLLGFIMATNFLQPLQKMAHTMQNIRKKGFQERMEPTNSRDEVAELTNIFNEMMDEIERTFEQQKQFVQDASHELRTPVQIMEGHLNLLHRWGKNDPAILEESLTASLQELQRMKKLVQEMLDLTRTEQLGKIRGEHKTDVLEAIIHVLKNFKVMHPAFTFHLNEDNANGIAANIHPDHFEQVMMILMDNAVKYSEDIEQVDVVVTKEDNQVAVSVVDYGIGIEPEDLNKIFYRFYRVDKARSRERGGNGLGLSIAKQIIDIYAGTIYAKSAPGKGTTITMLIPVFNESN